MNTERSIGIPVVKTVQAREEDFAKAEFRLNAVDSLTEFVDPFNYLGKFTKLYKDRAYPLIYSNHNQHSNIAGFRRIWRGMGEARPEHFNVIVAHSLTTGNQMGDLGSSSSAMKQMFEKENVHFLEVMRDKDVVNYQREGIPEEEIQQAIRFSRNNMLKAYLSLKKDNCGTFVFPAGTTVEADRDERGNRKGMQKVETPILPGFVEAARRFGREVAFLPVGHVNTFRIVEPRETRGKPLAYIGIGMERIGLGAPKLAKTVIGEPFTLSQMESFQIDLRNGEEVNDFAMRRVAQLLPVDARGYYR